jgi:hypothetical protein
MSVANMGTYTIVSIDVNTALEELFDIAYINADDVDLTGITDNNDGTYNFTFTDATAPLSYTVNYCI